MSDTEPEIRPLDARMGKRGKLRIRQPRRMLPWLITGGVVVAIWSFALSTSLRPPPGDFSASYLTGWLIGSVLGVSAFIAGAVGLIIHLIAGRRFTPGDGIKHFGILAIVAVFAASPFTGLALYSLHSGGQPQAVRTVLEEHKARAAEITARHDVQRRSAAARSLLEPDAIAGPNGPAAARQASEELDALHRDVFAEINALTLETERRLQAVPMGDASRQRLQASIDEERAIANRSEDMSRRALELSAAQLNVLSRSPRGWQVEDGQFVFQRQRDLDDFNAAAHELADLQVSMQRLKETTDAAAPR